MPQNLKISTPECFWVDLEEDLRDQEICFGHDGRTACDLRMSPKIEIGIVIIKKSRRHGTSPQAAEICLLIKN